MSNMHSGNTLSRHPLGPYSHPLALSKRDGRTREARLMRDTRAALTAHVGGNPSVTQRLLIDRAVQLTIRVATMDRKFAETEVQTEHDSRTYLAWTGSLSRILRDLGLQAVDPDEHLTPAERHARWIASVSQPVKQNAA